AGMRPMELALVSLGSCAAIDVIHILKKQRISPEKVTFWVEGDRNKDAVPSPFTGFHIHFDVFGRIPESKVNRAVDLAVEKYCSVGSMLQHSGPITHSCTVHETYDPA
ncbi:MAG: OsmC family protein, partial [Spirochaeta sp.]